MTQWLAYLAMWDFDLVHVSGKKNTVANRLSRMPQPDGWEPPDEPAEDDFIDMELNFTQLTFKTPQTRRLTLATEQVLKDSYLEESQEIAH
jgi:hypothetical protein